MFCPTLHRSEAHLSSALSGAGSGSVVWVKRGLALGAAKQTGFSTDRKPATLNPSTPRRRKSGDESPHSKKRDYLVRLDPWRTRRCQTQDPRRLTQGSELKAKSPFE